MKRYFYLNCVIILCVSLLDSVKGQVFRCYMCSFSATDSDRSCATIEESTHYNTCPMRYCTIMRQEYIDPPGQIASFVRGCEESPAYLNHDIDDGTFRTYFRACTNDLCNIGNGIQQIAGGALIPNPQETSDNLLVPGTGAAHRTASSSILATAIAVVLFYCKL